MVICDAQRYIFAYGNTFVMRSQCKKKSYLLWEGEDRDKRECEKESEREREIDR